MSEKFEIEIKPDKRDLWRFVLSQYFSFNNLLFSFVGFALFGLCLALLFLREYFSLPHIIDTLIAAALFTVFYSFVMTYLSVGDTDRYIGERCKYIFSNDEIVISGDYFKSVTKWNYFFRVKENNKNFLFYVKSGITHIIPKKSFQENELAGFKNLLREKLGDEAYLKKTKGNLGLK